MLASRSTLVPSSELPSDFEAAGSKSSAFIEASEEDVERWERIIQSKCDIIAGSDSQAVEIEWNLEEALAAIC